MFRNRHATAGQLTLLPREFDIHAPVIVWLYTRSFVRDGIWEVKYVSFPQKCHCFEIRVRDRMHQSVFLEKKIVSKERQLLNIFDNKSSSKLFDSSLVHMVHRTSHLKNLYPLRVHLIFRCYTCKYKLLRYVLCLSNLAGIDRQVMCYMQSVEIVCRPG